MDINREKTTADATNIILTMDNYRFIKYYNDKSNPSPGGTLNKSISRSNSSNHNGINQQCVFVLKFKNILHLNQYMNRSSTYIICRLMSRQSVCDRFIAVKSSTVEEWDKPMVGVSECLKYL